MVCKTLHDLQTRCDSYMTWPIWNCFGVCFVDKVTGPSTCTQRKSNVSRCKITYSSSYGKLCTCAYIKSVLFLFDKHLYSTCVNFTIICGPARGLRGAGWETLRACTELGFTSVSGWNKSPSHSCGLKSVAFLHTTRGGSWGGRRRESPPRPPPPQRPASFIKTQIW